MAEYAVLGKDKIKSEIMAYLSVSKRGFISKFDLVEIVKVILYKLKSGCQWHLLPVGHLFNGETPSWKTVFHQCRKWAVKEEWQKIWLGFSRGIDVILTCSYRWIPYSCLQRRGKG